MGLSERQTWRILAAYKENGARALSHRNRGRQPPNATSDVIKERIVALVRERYQNVNHTHLIELLEEPEGIVVSRSKVRRLLMITGLASSRNRRSRYRYRRMRMPQDGMLLQVDGSHHRWLEERSPWLTLLLAVDDTTGTSLKPCFGRQRIQRDTFAY